MHEVMGMLHREYNPTQYKKHKSNDWSRKLKVKEEKLSIMIQGVPRNITVGE